MSEILNPPAIIGEAIAGEAAKRASEVKQELEHLNSLVLDSTFDIAELLAEVKGGSYYGSWGYETFNDYVEQELDMKVRKAQYLVRIVNISKMLGISRTVYEEVKITKLREIFSLEPQDFFLNPNTNKEEPLSDHIKRLVGVANDMSLKEIVEEIKRLKGLVGDDELVYETICVKRIVRDSVIRPARELARQKLGSQGKDAEGDVIEYSDGACEEVIHADFLSDPNNTLEGLDMHGNCPDDCQCFRGGMDAIQTCTNRYGAKPKVLNEDLAADSDNEELMEEVFGDTELPEQEEKI